MKSLRDFEDVHKGEAAIIVGCGPSARFYDYPDDAVLIGVNDCEKFVEHGTLPGVKYLLTLDGPHHFREKRKIWIKNTKAEHFFAFSRKWDQFHPEREGRIVWYRGTRKHDCFKSDGQGLGFSNNSPYVALHLCWWMGFSHVGIIGVDIPVDHVLGKNKQHHKNLNRGFKQLLEGMDAVGGPCVANLSPESRAGSIPKMTWDELLQREIFNDPNIRRD